MKPLFAITKITILSTTRSYVFQSLFALLVICSIVLSLLLTGDGTAISHIKLSLDYTISITAFILILSILWLTCTIMNHDLDQYQMHIVAVKPLSRMTIWFGKFLGILIVHTVLLAISFTVFYIYLFFELNNSDYSKEDIKQIKQNILTGRNKIYPNLEKIQSVFNQKWHDEELELKKSGKILSESETQYIRNSIYYQAITQSGQVEPLKNKVFEFENSNFLPHQNIILKFRIFVGEPDLIARQNKPSISGFWEIYNNTDSEYELIKKSKKIFLSNIFYELKIPAEYVLNNKILKLRFTNESKNVSVFFQLAESPVLFITQTSFFSNYIRAFFVVFLSLVLITGIGCAVGGIFSFPIAIFALTAYLLTGSISNYIILSENTSQLTNTTENIGTIFSKSLLKIIIPLSKFEISEDLSNGTLITFNKIWELIFWYILLKELPFIFICIFIYSKRELGLIIKK